MAGCGADRSLTDSNTFLQLTGFWENQLPLVARKYNDSQQRGRVAIGSNDAWTRMPPGTTVDTGYPKTAGRSLPIERHLDSDAWQMRSSGRTAGGC